MVLDGFLKVVNSLVRSALEMEEGAERKMRGGIAGVAREDGLLFRKGRIHVAVERRLDDIISPETV